MVWALVEHNIVFYADNGHIAGHNSIWVHTTLAAVFRIFERVELQTKLGKTNSMVCTPVFIWGKQVLAVYKWKATG